MSFLVFYAYIPFVAILIVFGTPYKILPMTSDIAEADIG